MKDKANVAIGLAIISILLSLFLFFNSSFIKLEQAKNTIANLSTSNVVLEKENIALKRNLTSFLNDIKSIEDKNDELISILKKYRVE